MRNTRRNFHAPRDREELVLAIMVNAPRQTVRVGPIWSALAGEIVSHRRPEGETHRSALEKIAGRMRAVFRRSRGA